MTSSLLIVFPIRSDGTRCVVTPNRVTGTTYRFADGISDELRVARRLREFAEQNAVESSVHDISEDGATRLVWNGRSLTDGPWAWRASPQEEVREE